MFWIVTVIAWLVPTMGALFELLLGITQLFYLVAFLKHRKSLDQKVKRMLNRYIIMILLYFMIVGTLVFYVLRNEVNLQNDFLENLMVLIVLGPPMIIAFYFVIFLKRHGSLLHEKKLKKLS